MRPGCLHGGAISQHHLPSSRRIGPFGILTSILILCMGLTSLCNTCIMERCAQYTIAQLQNTWVLTPNLCFSTVISYLVREKTAVICSCVAHSDHYSLKPIKHKIRLSADQLHPGNNTQAFILTSGIGRCTLCHGTWTCAKHDAKSNKGSSAEPICSHDYIIWSKKVNCSVGWPIQGRDYDEMKAAWSVEVFSVEPSWWLFQPKVGIFYLSLQVLASLCCGVELRVDRHCPLSCCISASEALDVVNVMT